ncbi:acyl-acyl carrier protein thioesterase ATL3, chloroplastic-like [Rutidosis leptorrhynchoides]|uniref:acyl-acyl carrier protein thioesterase ATL3, chloroplastic-like n=1 Tax=Rutidosis leptorrhynchoides TaxID=125765 RepID=UPI003A99C183
MSLLSLPYGGHVIILSSRVPYGIQVPSSNVHVFPGTNHRQQLRLRSRSLKTTIRSSNNFEFDLKDCKGMKGYHDIELSVRDYEMDQYGVVNNAIYAKYCQHGRQQLMEKIGINIATITQSGNALALSDLVIKYIAPLRIGDKFTLRMRISDMSAARIYFEHLIFKIPNEEPILDARATAVWLDKDYRPVRIPTEYRSKYVQFLRHEDGS